MEAHFLRLFFFTKAMSEGNLVSYFTKFELIIIHINIPKKEEYFSISAITKLVSIRMDHAHNEQGIPVIQFGG
jgi:hypothetical protein